MSNLMSSYVTLTIIGSVPGEFVLHEYVGLGGFSWKLSGVHKMGSFRLCDSSKISRWLLISV